MHVYMPSTHRGQNATTPGTRNTAGCEALCGCWEPPRSHARANKGSKLLIHLSRLQMHTF